MDRILRAAERHRGPDVAVEDIVRYHLGCAHPNAVEVVCRHRGAVLAYVGRGQCVDAYYRDPDTGRATTLLGGWIDPDTVISPERREHADRWQALADAAQEDFERAMERYVGKADELERAREDGQYQLEVWLRGEARKQAEKKAQEERELAAELKAAGYMQVWDNHNRMYWVLPGSDLDRRVAATRGGFGEVGDDYLSYFRD